MEENEVTKQLISKAGAESLQAELEELKVVKRKEVAQKIKEAREQGDLSENAEYDAARDEQRDIEARIDEIDRILKNSEIVEETGDGKTVNIGTTVSLHDMIYDEDLVYSIVGSSETDSLDNKISNESPLGRALMNQKAGKIVEVETPVGTIIKYKIKSVKKTK